MARKNKHSNMQVGPDGLPVIDGFTVEEAIGEGGFSRVYRGTQDTPARPVAIKVFRTSGKVGARVRDRFKRESDVIGALSSEDGLVTVFTGGFTDSGAPYLAMELCDGGSVAGRISAHGGLPVGEVLAVGERIGSALAVVHGQQVAHRDVKPSNVLLKADGRAKLTDFGLSVVGEMTEPLGEESRLAVTEVYAPPERLNPGAEDGSGVDEAGDQYSFALTLYAMLLGGSPFTGETTTKRALKVLQGHIEPLIRQDIPPKLVHVLRRAMATRPEDRWPSMAELVAVLRTVAPNADTQSPEPLRPVASSTQAPSVTSKPRQQQFPALGASLADAPTNPTGMQEPPVMRTEVQNRPGASRSRLAAIGNRDHRNRPVPKEAATGHPVPFFTRALAHFGDVAPVPIAITGDGLVTAGQVTARLADLFAVPPDAIYFGDLRPSHDDPVQSLPGFHDGMITSTHSTHAAGGVSTDFEVLIDGGPAAGQVILLPVGQHVVGRDPSASIQIEDPQLNPLHFQVTLAADGMTFVQNFDSNAETLLEGRRLVGNVWVPEGARLFCGSSTISIRRLRDTTSRIAGSAEYEGTPQRSPARTYTNTPPVSLSRPPTVSSPPNGFTDVAAMTLGMATIFASALVMDNFVVAALVVLPPAGALISYRRRIRRFERSRRATWVDFSRMFADESEEFIRQKMEMADEQRRELPGPADVCQICSVPTHRLWGGRTTGNSHLRIRLGTQGKGLLDGGSLHARNHSWLQPVAAPLHEISSMGLVGPASAARASARFAVMQSAAHYGPQDLKVWAFLSEYCVEEWDFLRWLPHVQTDLGSPSLSVYVGRSSIREGIEKLQYLMHGRSELISAQSIPSSFADPAILAIFDTSDSGLDGEINRLLAGSQRLKVHGLVVAPDRTGVQFDALVKFDDATGLAQYEQHGGPPLRNVVFDGIAKHVAEGAARRLAALSVEEPRGLEIPTSVRLLDLLNLPEPTGDLIAERWQGSTRDLTRRKGVSSIVGHDGTGNVDLVLGQDLPNLLVAGAPGTGKSEFLLTLLAGLAAEQGPDDVRFIIIGFKGIQDFTIISKLPHTLDVVGNLGVRSFERAMRMMRNEVGRREIVLERAGAANIDAYRSMHRKGHQRAQQPLPRLIVIADEFAELKSQAPDQYDRLVSLTRLGRALGMHLILSTQSPAGVVNRQLEATIPVRISFKLIGPALSNEVIGDPAAGMLPMSARGRAFVSTQGASPVEVQMARVAGGRPDAAIEEPMLDVYPESLAETSQSHLRKAGSPFDPPDEETDLWGLMEACCDAAAKLGYAENSVPWAGPLPDEVLLSGSVDDEGHPVVGTVDDPDGVLSDRPIHRDYSIKLGEGHLCVFGTSGSGRSTALVSSAVALSLAAQPLHLFGIDNSNGGLSLLNELPNCGGLSPARPPVVAAHPHASPV
jgi:serine/threonine protein kinase